MYAPVILAFFKVVVPIIAAVFFIIFVSNAGTNKAKAKIAEQTVKDIDELNKRGEEWDGNNGLSGIVKRRLQRKIPWYMRKK